MSKMIFNINLRKLPSQYGEVSVMGHSYSVISTMVVSCLVSVIPLISTIKISYFRLTHAGMISFPCQCVPF